MSQEDESDIPNKNNAYVLHRQIEHSFVVFITYYTSDVDLMDVFVDLDLELFFTRK